MTPRPRQGPHRLQSLHAWVLTALLLAAQALGLAHRVAHAPGLPVAMVVVAPAAGPGSENATARSVGNSHAHADAQHEAGSPDCRLIDQLAHADALCGSAELRLTQPRATTVGTVAGVLALPLGSAAAYLARGPPDSA